MNIKFVETNYVDGNKWKISNNHLWNLKSLTIIILYFSLTFAFILKDINHEEDVMKDSICTQIQQFNFQHLSEKLDNKMISY